MTHQVEFVSYNGAWPNLCSGVLVVKVDGKTWTFDQYVMQSGGSVWFDDSWSEHVESGLWTIREWPEGFPTSARYQVTQCVNDNVPFGCCGGCV
jgi:hypothetical protein